MEQAKYDVFISYARKDYLDEQKNVIPGNVVSQVKEALMAEGIKFWFDEDGIISGQEFGKEITKSIEASKVFLFLASENSNKSNMVSGEIGIAVELNKNIIPFRIDESSYNDAVKIHIVNNDFIDYYINPEKGLTKMVNSIKKYLEQEEEKLIEDIRSANNNLNKDEAQLLMKREKLLEETKEVSNKEKRTTLQKEIQETSPISQKYQKERFSLLREIEKLSNSNKEKEKDNKVKSEELKQKNDQIKRLEKELNEAKNELEYYRTAEKRQAEAKGEFTVNGVSFKMIHVDGGTFQMGSDSGDRNEKPVHSVTLDNFFIGETEVTQELWEAVMGNNPSVFKGENLPVEKVSWEDICGKDGKGNDPECFLYKLKQITGKEFRLPTEAEWEFAARGGKESKTYKYSGSDTLDHVAWYEKNSGDKTHPVKTKSPNQLGLYDMSGNVYEWCQDWYKEDYYSSSPRINPPGPSSGSHRIIRGGHYIVRHTGCRVEYRRYNLPTNKSKNTGFRLAL